MPLFISYSHADKGFVDRLATQLVAHKVHVWLDRWELHVGDSLISKIQEAITGASGLLLILSKASVKSEWCKKELNSGLFRELDEKRVIVLPVLIEKCKIPLFLKEKKYADFRTNYDDGFNTIMESIASVTNEWQGRIKQKNWHTDWSIDWGKVNGRDTFRFTMVDHGTDMEYVVLTTTTVLMNDKSAAWYQARVRAGTDHLARHEIVSALAAQIEDRIDLDIILEDQLQVRRSTEFSVNGLTMMAVIESRRLGMDVGWDVYVRVRDQLGVVARSMHEITRTEPDETRQKEVKSRKKTKDKLTRKAKK